MKKSITLTIEEWDGLWEASYNTLGLRSDHINNEELQQRKEFNIAVRALNKVGEKIGYKKQKWTARGTNEEIHNYEI